MDKKRIRSLYDGGRLTLKGAIEMYLEHGPAGEKEVVNFLQIDRRSFYRVLKALKKEAGIKSEMKTTQYSLEK